MFEQRLKIARKMSTNTTKNEVEAMQMKDDR